MAEEQSPDPAHPGHGCSQEDAEQERLLSYWQSVGRGHQVDVPRVHPFQTKWACIKMQEEQYEQSICLGFMKLMKYICEQNSSGLYLGMTIPIVTLVHTNESHSEITRSVTVAYYLPELLQEQPPQPYDSDIIIEEWPPTVVYTRSFRGVTNEDSIMREINFLAELLESPELCLQNIFIVAGYTNPAAANRHNEIWFLQRP
uniref:Heme-binding protein 2 n=1 Tax=Chelydra serpentina TaxID=8475 RepID=A0A8C3TA74_CHESE